ncbi:MAG: glycosyltransferase [Nostoc sp.]|uniref:glycosyltransferase n=1 Tax=Nostoc sp. TaxID=1180 RepID=UPI002FFB42B5
MNTSNLISIIVVVKNGERYLKAALDSIQQQNYSNYETIVIDGASTDRTAEIAQSYLGMIYQQQDGKGLAQARNTGISVARGELITFLDHDDYWEVNSLSQRVDSLLSEPQIQGIVGYLQKFFESDYKTRESLKHEEAFKPIIGYTPGTLLARRTLFEQVGGFNSEFKIGCDSEWFARAQDQEILLKVLPLLVLYKRLHNNNLSCQKEVYRQEIFILLQQSLKRRQAYKR